MCSTSCTRASLLAFCASHASASAPAMAPAGTRPMRSSKSVKRHLWGEGRGAVASSKRIARRGSREEEGWGAGEGGGAAHRPPHRHLNRHRRLDCQPGDRVAKQPLFCVRRYVVLRDRPRIRVRLEYSREPTSVGACALCRGSQQVSSAQQDRSAGPVSGLERVRERSALADTVAPLVSVDRRGHLRC